MNKTVVDLAGFHLTY